MGTISTPQVMQSPQSDFALSLAQQIANVAQQQMGWATGVYAQTSNMTDQNVQQYLSLANQGTGLAGNALNQYENTFAPLQSQYAANAQSYASAPRMAEEMGAAESRAMQAGQQAQANSERQLQSYGVDPSSGRYQDLIRASNTADAASAAAAGEVARRNVEQTGNQRQLNAVEIGQQLPGQAVNALNAAYQGVSGAENAVLGNANTGANLMSLADKYYNTAMGLKYPPVGNSSTSGQVMSTTNTSGQGGGSGGGSGGGGGGYSSGAGYGTSAPYNPNWDSAMYSGPGGVGPGGSSTGSGFYGSGPGSSIMQMQPDSSTLNGNDSFDGSSGYDYTGGDTAYGPSYNSYDPGSANFGGQSGSFDGNWDNATGGAGYLSNAGYTPQSANYGAGSSFDYSGFGGDSGNTDYSSNFSGGGDQYNTYGSDFSNASSPINDQSYDNGSFGDSGAGSDSGDFAAGGYVPPRMSPSRGQRTDDVKAVIPQTGGRARINVGEFVIPRDVVARKGLEFFEKMIHQSRKTRLGMRGGAQHASVR